MRKARLVFIGVMLAAALPAMAAQPAYLDDRSTAASLVRSFYNAVNRHEYARAYTYFDANAAPLPYAKFAAGYADTAAVKLSVGEATADGAAGSTYFTLPVAIDATQASGTHKRFAGCYILRLVNPAVQDPPVTPMVIFKADLHAASTAALPNCAH